MIAGATLPTAGMPAGAVDVLSVEELDVELCCEEPQAPRTRARTTDRSIEVRMARSIARERANGSEDERVAEPADLQLTLAHRRQLLLHTRLEHGLDVIEEHRQVAVIA